MNQLISSMHSDPDPPVTDLHVTGPALAEDKVFSGWRFEWTKKSTGILGNGLYRGLSGIYWGYIGVI